MDYKKAYYILFNAVTDAEKYLMNAIQILNKAQLKTEDMYLSDTEKLDINEKTKEKE